MAWQHSHHPPSTSYVRFMTSRYVLEHADIHPQSRRRTGQVGGQLIAGKPGGALRRGAHHHAGHMRGRLRAIRLTREC